jgi:hypothetical protein
MEIGVFLGVKVIKKVKREVIERSRRLTLDQSTTTRPSSSFGVELEVNPCLFIYYNDEAVHDMLALPHAPVMHCSSN